MEIYQGGLAGLLPEQPVAIEELEAKARSLLSLEAFDYVAGGAGSEDTVRANR
jgi:lactate 2-monooxygenase